MKNRIKKNLVIVLIVVAIVSGYIVKSHHWRCLLYF